MAKEKGKILITLTPSESKRLIAKGVRNLEEVQRALKHGTIILTLGTTNAYVVEEILNDVPGSENNKPLLSLSGSRERGQSPRFRGQRGEAPLIDKQRYAAGVITDSGTCVVPKEEREKEVVLKNGKMSEESMEKAIENLSADDVFIKGANALDATGTAGVFMANTSGGTIGSALGTVMARGVRLIIPIGIEKTIPYSITEAAKRVGIEKCYKSMGWPVGLMPVHGTVITEIEALKILGAEDAFPIGAGGVDGGEGSVVICVEGSVEKLDELMGLVTQIKGEAPVKVVSKNCRN
ncbi:MAG: hypothetical protein IBX41_06100 [Methanophagales archaeon]|nr:hypothetical protein [Methanophagales archaeon]